MGLYKRKLVVKVAHQTVMATLTIMADVDGRWGWEPAASVMLELRSGKNPRLRGDRRRI